MLFGLGVWVLIGFLCSLVLLRWVLQAQVGLVFVLPLRRLINTHYRRRQQRGRFGPNCPPYVSGWIPYVGCGLRLVRGGPTFLRGIQLKVFSRCILINL